MVASADSKPLQYFIQYSTGQWRTSFGIQASVCHVYFAGETYESPRKHIHANNSFLLFQNRLLIGQLMYKHNPRPNVVSGNNVNKGI